MLGGGESVVGDEVPRIFSEFILGEKRDRAENECRTNGHERRAAHNLERGVQALERDTDTKENLSQGDSLISVFNERMLRAEKNLHAETPLPLLIGADGTKEVDLPEGGPVNIRKVEFTVGALPQQEARQAYLTTRPDDEIGIGHFSHVQVIADGLRSNVSDRIIECCAVSLLLG